MVEVSLIELPSWNCLQINVTRTLLKINPPFVQVHLMTWCTGIMLCDRTVVADPSAISRQSVGYQLGSNQQPIGDRSATGWRLYLEHLFLIAESLQLFGDRSATGQRLVGDQSATKNCAGIVCNHCNWSAISHQPVGHLSATTKNLSTVDLVAKRFRLQQPNLLAIKSSLQPSATGRRPPCNLPATTQNFGHKEVADRLQAMCDRGLRPVFLC